jgi:hypothetical protein
MKQFFSAILFLLLYLSACSPGTELPQAVTPAAGHAGTLRVVYSKQADPWIWTEGEGARQLADSVNVMEVAISSDGQVVAFKRDDTGEVFAVDADGSNLHPLVSAQFLTGRNAMIWAFDFAPDSHDIFFTMKNVGSSFVPFYDLYQVAADAAIPVPNMVFAPGHGGIATFSSDGNWMTLYHLGGLDLTRVDGSEVRNIFSYPEGYEPATFGPQIVWMEDSSGFALFHTQDPMGSMASSGLWFVPVNGEPGVRTAIESPWGVPSPDGQRVGYSTPGSPSEIHIVEADGTDAIYKTFENAYFQGWAPDSLHFVVVVEEVKDGHIMNIPYLCSLGEEPVPLTDTGAADSVVWVTADEFLFASWGELRLQRTGEASLLLDSQVYNILDYTLITP